MFISRRGFLTGALGAALVGSDALGDELRWYDVHMHLVGGHEQPFGQAIDDAVAAMDEFGVAKAVVFPPPTPRAGIFDYADYVPELRRHPGRFGFLAGGGTLNPMLHQIRASDVTPAIKQKWIDDANRMLDVGAVGFGEIAVLHLSLVPNHPFEQTTADHPLLLTLVDVADRRKAVIDLHMDPVIDDSMALPEGLKTPPNPKTLSGNVAALERLLAHGRDARIVWAHGGSDFTGNMTPALIERLMEGHSNLYMSLRPIPFLLRPTIRLAWNFTISSLRPMESNQAGSHCCRNIRTVSSWAAIPSLFHLPSIRKERSLLSVAAMNHGSRLPARRCRDCRPTSQGRSAL